MKIMRVGVSRPSGQPPAEVQRAHVRDGSSGPGRRRRTGPGMIVVMPSLTRTEATARAATVDVHQYEVDLDLTAEGDTFRAVTVLRFGAQPGASTFLEFEPVEVESMTLNGAAVPPAALDGDRLTLTGLAADNELAVTAVMRYSNNGEGLHKYVDPGDGNVYLYQHMFINNAGRILPSFDQPDLKASFRVGVTAPADWLVATNGQLVTSEDGR